MRRIAALVALSILAATLSVAEAAPASAATAPDPPTGVSAIAGDGSANVSWTAPVVIDPVDAITGYTVTASPDGASCTSTPPTTSCTVGGLTNGTAYTFTVIATNSTGPSLASSPSNSVTPSGGPSAPTGVSAAAGNGQATVSWNAANGNGSGITGYIASASPGGASCPTSGLSCTVTGLTNGQPYTFTVVANNANGPSPFSSPSSPVTPATAPGAPVIGTATAQNGTSALVTWTAPASVGGAPITKYVVTSAPGSKTCQTNGTLLCTVTGLTQGGTYTFTVFAQNSVGPSPDSAPTAAIILPNAPDAPTGVTATSGYDLTVPVGWLAAADNGSPITSYKATASPGGGSCTAPGTDVTCNVTGLTNGTAYTFTVTATNAEGTSPPSAASASATPASSPSPVLNKALVAGRGTAHLTWAPPLDSNGSPIVDYIVTVTVAGVLTPPPSYHTVGPVTFMNLDRLPSGRSISFAIQARNSAVGQGQLGTPTSIVGLGTGVTGTPYPSRVSYGIRTRIAGRLITTIGTSLPTRPLLVQYRPLGSLTWRSLARVGTNQTGVYGAFVRPAVNTQYRVLFPGGIRVMGGASHNILVGVSWRFRVKQSARRIFAGSSVTFTGSILPVKANKAILLQKYEGRRWITKQTAKTNVRSRFVLNNTPKKLGTYLYRLYISASGGHLASVTGRMTMTVVAKPKPAPRPAPRPGPRPSIVAFVVSVAQSASSVFSGGVVVFSGRVSPSHQPKTVLLQRIEVGKWVTKQSVVSTAAGVYHLAYHPSKRGTFTYRMYVAATSAHKAGVSRLVRLTIL